MNYLISQNVPICPECQGLLMKRYQNLEAYFYCVDCKTILRIIGTGKAEIELIVTDGKEKS